MSRKVRCKTCGRLLAVILDNGMIESRGSRQAVLTERALLSCLKCGGEVLIDAGKILRCAQDDAEGLTK